MPQIILNNVAITSWAVPADWNPSDNKIEIVAGGGRGAASNVAVPGYDVVTSGGGGGGGAYAIATNVDITSSPVAISWGSIGGMVTFGSYCSAQWGADGVNQFGGAGGTVFSPNGYRGGDGGTGIVNTITAGGVYALGCGGGGSGGPSGQGGNGGNGGATTGGAGGSANGGLVPGGVSTNWLGVNGISGTEWGTVGCGSGAAAPLVAPGHGGYGASAGGGSAGGGASTPPGSQQGVGGMNSGNPVIVITYEPLVAAPQAMVTIIA